MYTLLNRRINTYGTATFLFVICGIQDLLDTLDSTQNLGYCIEHIRYTFCHFHLYQWNFPEYMHICSDLGTYFGISYCPFSLHNGLQLYNRMVGVQLCIGYGVGMIHIATWLHPLWPYFDTNARLSRRSRSLRDAVIDKHVSSPMIHVCCKLLIQTKSVQNLQTYLFIRCAFCQIRFGYHDRIHANAFYGDVNFW